MGDTVFKTQQGVIFLPSADPEGDARTVIHPTKVIVPPHFGAEAENIPLFFTNSAINVINAGLVAAQTVTAGANNPTVKLQYGDVAGGALTDITGTIAGTAVTLTARVESAFTISAAAVPKNVMVYLNVATNGTPADIDPVAVKMNLELAG